MKTTKLDDVVCQMQDPPMLVKRASEAISIDDYIHQTRPLEVDVTTIEMSPLDAAMYGLSFNLERKDGTVHRINPDGPIAKIKDSNGANLNSEAKEFILENIVKAVIANEDSFGKDTAFSYAKMSIHELPYQLVTNYAAKRFAELETEHKIKLINPVEKIYAR